MISYRSDRKNQYATHIFELSSDALKILQFSLAITMSIDIFSSTVQSVLLEATFTPFSGMFFEVVHQESDVAISPFALAGPFILCLSASESFHEIRLESFKAMNKF